MKATPDKPSRPFSMLGGTMLKSRRPTLTLSGLAAPKQTPPKPAVAKPPPKPGRQKAAATPKPAAPAVAAPKPPAPKPAPAAQPPDTDPRIAARMAALAIARREFPAVFSADFPPLPGDIIKCLKDLTGDGRAAQDALDWWAAQPGFRKARAARQRQSAPNAEARAETLAIVQSFAPDLFDPAAPKPLAIGIHQQLAARGIAPEAANTLLRHWTRQPAYRRAVAAGGSRFNLDGTEAGVISAEHQQDAGLKARERH